MFAAVGKRIKLRNAHKSKLIHASYKELIMKRKKIAVLMSSVFFLLTVAAGFNLGHAQTSAEVVTVRSIMKQQLAPNATTIWEAVSYIATEQGVEEHAPQTDADWMALRANAVALMEAARLLKQPGLPVDLDFNRADYVDYQYTPDEIAALVKTQNAAWLRNLEAMENFTLQTMRTIERQDLVEFAETNARINEACQDCHASFWYRPEL